MPFFSAGAPYGSIVASGTTTPRSPEERFAEIYNVRDFGAVGNSNYLASTGTDDAPAIQAAVTAAAAAGGGVIFFPEGCYRVDVPINFYAANVQYTFRGVGSSNAHNGVTNGSCLVANMSGFILDRNVLSTGQGRVLIEGLGFINISGGCIRAIGHDTSRIQMCSLQGATYCIKMGQFGYPPGASFTATAGGVAMDELTVTDLVNSANPLLPGYIYAVTFPLPIVSPADFGGAVPNPTTIIAQISGTPEGVGVYRTSGPTTCSGTAVNSHPNAPTAFSSVVDSCIINGGGTFNTDPALSFYGVGVQLGTNSFVQNCHINNFASAIQIYGSSSGIQNCQMESNTIGILVGRDGEGNGASSTAVSIIGCSLESNYIGIDIYIGNQITIQSTFIQVNTDGPHNSIYGIRIQGGIDINISTTLINGETQVGGFGFYLQGGAELHRIRTTACQFLTVGKHSSVSWACIVQEQCQGFYTVTVACTLAQLNTSILNGDVCIGEHRMISDADKIPYDGSGTGPVQSTHQILGAPVTGLGGNLALVYYDGTVRYG